MTMAWMLWTVLVSACVALAARALEEVAHLLGRPLRWVWAGALAGSAAAPVLAHLALRGGSGAAGGGEVTLGAFATGVSDGAAAAGSAIPWAAELERLDGLLLAAWAAGSVAILLVVALAALAFALRRRGWQEAEVDGHRVLLTRDIGPAVAGLLRGRIVLPAWALQLAPPLRALMLEHEAEHLRAGDPRLLGGGLLLVALLPWNPVAWWQLRRLRLAIEVDCDARVLRRHPDARTYGDLLLAMGARTRRMPLAAAAAFSEPRTTLETRIRKMIERPARPTAVRLMALLAVSGGAIAFACEAPAPQDPLKVGLTEEVAEATDAAQDQAGLTAYTTPPRVTNPDEVQELITTSYPPLLLDAGMGGEVAVWFYVGKDGRVEELQQKTSSGFDALDKAAMKVAAGIRFEPADKDGEPVAAWVSLPIRFDNAAARTAEDEVALPPPPEEVADPAIQAQAREAFERLEERRVPANLAAAPQFTPFERAPTLQNRSTVERLLRSEYPEMLRSAGIGGGADMWFFIDEAGVVQEIKLKASSGYEALDQAAMRVAQQMEFTAASNRDKPVPVWVSLQIEFTAR